MYNYNCKEIWNTKRQDTKTVNHQQTSARMSGNPESDISHRPEDKQAPHAKDRARVDCTSIDYKHRLLSEASMADHRTSDPNPLAPPTKD